MNLPPTDLPANNPTQPGRRATVAEVRDAARGHWRRICLALAPALQDAIAAGPSRHIDCPVHGGEHGDAFRIFPNFDETGGTVCNSCGPAHDGIETLIFLNSWKFDDAVRNVAEFLGVQPATGKKRGRPRKTTSSTPGPTPSSNGHAKKSPIDPAATDAEIAKARAKILARWQQATIDTGRIAAYLVHRGLSVAVPLTLKLSRQTYYGADGVAVGEFPCMLGLFTGEQGIVSLHRTYLSATDPGKADVPTPKKWTQPVYHGATSGAAIRLYLPGSDDTTLAITEGIETALAVHQATGLPVWAAGSAGNLAAVEIPAPGKRSKIRRVELWIDPGKAGEDAGEKAATRLAAEGFEVVVICPNGPNDGAGDWLDVLVAGGEEALRAAQADAKPVDAPSITKEFDVENYTLETDDEGNNKRISIILPEIAKRVHDSRDEWPREISGLLFVQGKRNGAGAIRFVKSVNDLFAWFRERGHVRWARGCSDATPPTREELYSYLITHAQKTYDSVAFLPHYPIVSNTYYVPCDLPAANGKAVAEFLDHLNPETDQDRGMLLAAMLTPGWGGPPGQRPAFLITSPHGRGAGKSKTAEAISAIWGGCISSSLDRNSLDVLRSRLLDDSALPLRCALADNLKGHTSSAGLEALITASVIDGKRMYHGDFRRVNNLTWFVTANSPSLSKDLADRSVIVRIGNPRIDDFVGWYTSFLEVKGRQLIADLLAILAGPNQCEIARENLDRWSSWQQAVLQKLPNGNTLAMTTKELRPSVDADLEDAELVADAIRDVLVKIKLGENLISKDQIDSIRIGIPVAALFDPLRTAWQEPNLSPKAIRFRLNQLLGVGPLSVLRDNPTRSYGRTLLWSGSKSDANCLPVYPWSYQWCLEHKNSLILIEMNKNDNSFEF